MANRPTTNSSPTNNQKRRRPNNNQKRVQSPYGHSSTQHNSPLLSIVKTKAAGMNLNRKRRHTTPLPVVKVASEQRDVFPTTITKEATITTTSNSNVLARGPSFTEVQDFSLKHDDRPVPLPSPPTLLLPPAKKEQQQQKLEERRSIVRKKWRKAIRTIMTAGKAVAKFEEPIKQRKQNLARKLSQTMFLSSNKKGKATKTEKQCQEEDALQTVVKNFHLRRKESYVDTLSLSEMELEERKANGEDEDDEDAIEDDLSVALPNGFGRGMAADLAAEAFEAAGVAAEGPDEKNHPAQLMMQLGTPQMSRRAELLLAFKHRVVHPQAPFKQSWDFGMFLLIAYLLVAIPYQVAFGVATPEGQPPSFFDVWDIMVDALFWFDICLSFNTAFYDKQKQLVVSRKEIARGYLKLWFWIDLLAAIPIDKIVTGVLLGGGGNKAVKLVRGVRLLRQIRLLKLLRLARLSKLLRKKKSKKKFSVSRSGPFFKMLRLVGVVMFLAHFFSCMWYAMSDESIPESGFLTWGALEKPHTNLYLTTLYHVTAMLISDQGGVEPRSNLDLVFCTFCMLAGSVVISVVFGQMALIISNMNAQTSGFQRKMERLHSTMKYGGIPDPLQQRIFRYYTYLWEEHRTIDGNPGAFVEELSANLSAEVTLFLRRRVIATNLIFSKCYAEELHDIVLAMKRSFYMPGDYVLREGAIGQGLYLVHTGEIDVLITRPMNDDNKDDDDDGVSDDDDEASERTMRVSILGPGAHFGSKSLWLRKQELASVVARTNCEILILERKKFAWLCAKHKGLTDRVLYDAHGDDVVASSSKSNPYNTPTKKRFSPQVVVPQKNMKKKEAGA